MITIEPRPVNIFEHIVESNSILSDLFGLNQD